MPKRRVARRPAPHRPDRTARPSSPSSSPGTTRRWWNRITATIITLGALAGAIGAILALRPSPDPQDSARLIAVHVTPQVPLSEYRQRSATMVPQPSGHGLGRQRDRGALPPAAGLARATDNQPPSPVTRFTAARVLQPDPTTSPTDPAPDTSAQEPPPSDDTASSSPDTASPDTSTPDTASPDTSTPDTSTSSTTGPLATSEVGTLSSSVGLAVPSAFQQEGFDAYAQEVLELAAAQDPDLKLCEEDPKANSDDCIEVAYFIPPVSVDTEGNPVAPAVAAERVVELLRGARSTGGEKPGGEKPGGEKPGGEKPKGEPLGVVVSADLELAGLRGKPVLLSWSMWQQGGKKRLYGNWLNNNLAYRLKATTDRDTTTLDLWVPLPRSRGPYFIRVSLTAAESVLASADSPPFD
jgi:hypothetical protein